MDQNKDDMLRSVRRLWACRIYGMALFHLCITLTGCGPMTFVVGVAPGDQRLATTVIESDGGWFNDRIAIVDVSGMIYNADKPGLIQQGENPVSLLHEQLELARHDQKVKAVILRLNTPGGTVTASDAMYRMIKRFRAETGKPVLAMMMDVTASGGYYVACAADQIMAYPTTVTGSIGVIVQTISFKPAMTRLGIEAEAITSGPNKDAGSPLSTLTEEHRNVLEEMVDDFYSRFLGVVRESRPRIKKEDFTMVTDGRVVTGRHAGKLGLVDRVGDIQEAYAWARQLAGVQKADLVAYHRPIEYVGSPYAATPVGGAMSGSGVAGRGTQINLAQFNFPACQGGSSTMFYYLWPLP